MIGGGDLFGGGKDDPLTSTYKVDVQNWPEQLEAGIDLMPVNAMRGSMVNITVNSGNAGAKDIARALYGELALT